MTTYTAHFRTDARYAIKDLEADTPEHALKLARRYLNEFPSELIYEDYNGEFPVNEIAICRHGDDDELARWLDDEMRLRLFAADLLEALKQARTALNTAPRFAVPSLDTDSYRIATICERAIARATGGGQ